MDFKSMSPKTAIITMDELGYTNRQMSQALGWKQSKVNYYRAQLRNDGIELKRLREPKQEPKNPVRPAGVRLTVAEWWRIKNINPQLSMSDNIRRILLDAKIIDTLEIE